MPGHSEHVRQARHNRAFMECVRRTGKYRDWVVTSCFYCALHFVDAALSTVSVHPNRHEDRNSSLQWLKRSNRKLWSDAGYKHYRELQTQSRKARYSCESISEREVADAIEEDLTVVVRWAYVHLTRFDSRAYPSHK